jgi:hypothetical protein
MCHAHKNAYLFNQQNTDNYGLDGLTWSDESKFDKKTFMHWKSYTGSVSSSPLTNELTFEMIKDDTKMVSKIVQEDVMFIPMCQRMIPTGTY